MERVFLQLVNMSISAGWLVLAILPLRVLLKKAPRWAFCALWGLVGLRLLLPASLESALSLLPSAETIPPSIVYEAEPEIHSGIPALNSAVNPIISESFAPDPTASANPLQIWSFAGAIVWAIGLTAMLLYAFTSYAALRARMRTATLMAEGVYQSELAGSPFVLGIFKPAIYLPYTMDGADMAHVTAHERAHISRRDHLIKPFAFLLLSVYWFNPLMWLAYVLLARDIEMACDQKVVKGLDDVQRRAYSTALLNCSVGRARIAACPLAFGEVSVKERVKGVLNYKKPGFWIVAAAVLACVVAAACFLTDPENEEPDTSPLNYKNVADAAEAMMSVPAIYYPETEDGSGSIVPVEADGSGLAALLDGEEWSEREAPSGAMANAAHAQYPGSVKFNIGDDYSITVYGSPSMAAVAYGDEARYYSTQPGTYANALALLDTAPFGREYRVAEVLYDAPQYSFSLTVANAPCYRLGEDMSLHVLEDRDSDNWLHPGYFSTVNLTEDSFDKYFEANGSGDWMGWQETARALREENLSAWRLIVGEGEGGAPDDVFYYLLRQRGGGVYLTYGYYGRDAEAGVDDSSIRWLFELSPVQEQRAVATSGDNSVTLARYAPGAGLMAIQAGVPWLEIDPYEHEDVPFRVFVDGEERYGRFSAYDAETLEPLEFISPSGLAPQTYMFSKATPGRSYIVTMREGGALYCFGAELPDYGGAAGLGPDGMTPYRSTWCVYLNPLSSAARTGDSGMEYRLGEDSLIVINRNSGEVVAMSTLMDWEWTQLAQVDSEWARQLRRESDSAFGPDLDISGYGKPLAMELGAGYCLLNMDGELWIVETRENPQMGEYIWSIYGIAPAAGAVGSPDMELLCTGDFDGDGLDDSVRAMEHRAGALINSAGINVAYGEGRTVWMDIAGSWFYPPQCSAADFDGDGMDDLLVVLEHYGSNYGASEAYVYRGGEDAPALSLTPADMIEANRELFEEGVNGFSGHLGDCIGASVLRGEGRDLLRVRMQKDYDPGLSITTAWYVDMELEGNRWDIADVHMGEAYGEDRILEYDAAKAMNEWGRGKKVCAYYSRESAAISLDVAGGITFNGGGMELREQEGGEYAFRRPGEDYDPLTIGVYEGRSSGTGLLYDAMESIALDGERLAHGGSLFSPGQFADGIDVEVLKYISLTRREGVSRVYTTCCVENPQRSGEVLSLRFLNAVEENGKWQVIQSESDCSELMDTLRFTGA